MTEKGLIVQNYPAGTSIATRDGVETDENGNARVIQRFDFTSGKGPSPVASALIRTAQEADDTFDISNFIADLTGNLITIGDKSILVVFVEFEDNTDASLDITPILYDNEASPGVVGHLLPKTFSFASASAIYRGTTANYMTAALTWDLVGTFKVGLHISNYTQTGNGHPVNVWGYVI